MERRWLRIDRQATMERNRHSDGNYQWAKFMEHWGMSFTALTAIIVSQVFMFFMNLSGARWIYFFIASFVLLFSGAASIVYAKLPVYRSGRFFTFGVKSVPEHLVGYYRWGWRVFLFGMVLSLCLLLSRR
jgi:hypothetical protein